METEKNEPILDETATDVPATEPMVEEILPVTEEPVDVTQRLAEDFLALAEEFPQFITPDQLPDTVLDMAVTFTSHWPAFLPTPRRLRREIGEHFARFAAGDLLDKPVGHLSGGELQRVLVALATRPHPDMLLLDEPVSGVDEAGLQVFYELLEQLRREDMVILLISHDLAFVRRQADRVLLLDRRVLAKGAPAEVFQSPAFGATFPKGGVD